MNENKIIELVKEEKYDEALNIFEDYICKLLLDKLQHKVNIDNYTFMEFVNYCIKELPDYFDILTYIRNLYFFSNKSSIEKINELTNICINLKNVNI